jgi:NTP pyrophosphatase (non-canonical NTP hydrolase)
MELNSELDRLQKYLPIEKELIKAKELHPKYPKDIFWQLAIMSEEAGEVAKAVNDYVDGKTSLSHVKEELYQTAAMCIRMLENLPKT